MCVDTYVGRPIYYIYGLYHNYVSVVNCSNIDEMTEFYSSLQVNTEVGLRHLFPHSLT